MERLLELVRLHRMGIGVRETAQALRMDPTIVRDYRNAFRKAQLLDGSADALPALDALRVAVAPQATTDSSPESLVPIDSVWSARIIELASAGLKPHIIYDRLRLEDPKMTASYPDVRSVWRQWSIARRAAMNVAEPGDPIAGDRARVDLATSASCGSPPVGRSSARGCSCSR